jgi:calcineurin-like phosphoesterase family protein
MTTWFTSDWHLGHPNILAFDNRPWDTIRAHDQGIIENFNSVVKPGDMTYIVGDIFLGAYAVNMERIARVLHSLNGSIAIIGGNHDTPLRRFKGSNYEGLDDLRKSLEHKLVVFEPRNKYLLDLPHPKYYIEVSHYPRRAKDTRPQTMKPLIRIHGHTHSPDVYSRYCGTHHLNVAVTAHNYKPVSFDTLMEAYKRGLKTHK